MCRLHIDLQVVHAPHIPPPPHTHRASTGGTQGVDAVKAELAALRDDLAAVDAELRATEDAIDGLKKEKELQSGGEVKELTAQSDALSKSLVQHTSEWNVKKKALQKERNNLKQVQGVGGRVGGVSFLLWGEVEEEEEGKEGDRQALKTLYVHMYTLHDGKSIMT